MVPHTDAAPGGESRGTRWMAALPVAIAVAVFPPLLKVLDAPVSEFPVALSAPAPAAGWVSPAARAFDYRPVYAGARAEVSQTYATDDAQMPVVLHAAWYFAQRDGSEMVAWANGPASPALDHVSLVRGARTLTIAGQPVRENLIATP